MKNKTGITLVALIITIIVMLILAGIGINITTGIIDKATYSTFVAEMKNIEEAVNMHILEKNMETANGENPGAIFQTALAQEDLDSPDFPVELKQEILYVRAKLANSEITTTPADYNAGDLTTDDLFFVDSSVAEGKEKAYVYDEQSKSIFKAKPTIISGKSMFGNDYGKIIGVQGLLAQPITPTPPAEDGGWTGSVNAPKITGTGLIPVTIAETGENAGAVTEVSANSVGWYDYKVQTVATTNGGDSKWANAITKNSDDQITGMFVWIPRFAYKITSGFNTGGNTTGTIDVVFLKGTTDKYEINGTEYTSKRLSEEGVDTNLDYFVVHPCFTKTEVAGVKTYNQGEWDEEVEGIWVAKFEAGYAETSNYTTTTKTDSAIKYGIKCDTTYYGTTTANETPIPYPVFLPKTYSYCNITISDTFRISKETGNGNTYYNLNNEKVDSHLMKNSEWGAVAYLAQSQYGRNGTEITINNVFFNNLTNATGGQMTGGQMTGYAGNSVSENHSFNNSWETAAGKLASTTGNVYGVYDMSGGAFEYTAGYLTNSVGEINRNNYGSSLINEKEGRYKTIYLDNNSNDDNYYNYRANIIKRGDAIFETSNVTSTSTTANSWNQDYSYFSYSYSPFFHRGGHASYMTNAGAFAFIYCSGRCCLQLQLSSSVDLKIEN